MKLIRLLLLFIFSTSACGYSKGLSEKQKTTDFLYLHDILKENYPFFGVCKRQTGLDWLSQKDEYSKLLTKTKTDAEYVMVLENILKELNCKYIDLSPTRHWDKFRTVYGEVCLFNPAYIPWVNMLNKSAERAIYWNRLLTDNGNYIPANQKESETCNYKNSITADGRIAIMRIASFDVKHLLPDFPHIDHFLNNLEEADYLIIDLQGNKGGTTNYWVEGIVSRLIHYPIDFERKLVIKNGESNRHFYPSYFEKGNRLKKEIGLPGIPDELTDGSFRIIHETTTITPFMPIPFRGNIIILIDGQTFSSADELASFSKSTGWATVVGNTSSGGGTGSDPALIQLPESGIIIRYPALTGFNPDGSLTAETGTVPDLKPEGENADERLESLIQLITDVSKL